MRILMGLICMCMMTVALCGCDDDKQTTAQPATPVAKPVPAEPAEEAQPAVPVAKPVPATPAADPDAVVATVNGTPIKNAAVTAELDKRLKAMKMRMQPGQEMPAAQIQQMRIGVEGIEQRLQHLRTGPRMTARVRRVQHKVQKVHPVVLGRFGPPTPGNHGPNAEQKGYAEENVFHTYACGSLLSSFYRHTGGRVHPAMPRQARGAGGGTL